MKSTDLVMPSWFGRMESLPEDPENSVVYGYGTGNADCFAIVYPLPAEQSMTLDGKERMINGIRQCLQDNQGLIEVEEGKTALGQPYLYTIVKTLKNPGVQYVMTMHLAYPETTIHVQGVFNEEGTTGMRDAVVYAMLSNEGKVKITDVGIEGWSQDPYDPAYKKGVCMNCSEQAAYDELFPQHPLSEARRFAAELIRLN